jgi:hypothetical protein
MEFPSLGMLELLRSMRRLCFQSDNALVDVDSYARLRGLSIVRL